MVFVPVPAVAGLKNPVIELTPGPEYIPPSGIPPLSLMGFAFVEVMVSKQGVNVTTEAKVPLMMIFAELAGFPVTQGRLDDRMHRTLSPFNGLYE